MTGRILGAATAALLVAGGALGLNAQERTFEWQGEMRAGDLLEVRGIVGEVRAELGSGSTAEVIAEKRGREGDFDEVEIRVIDNGDGYTVCAVYHAREAREDSCESGNSGRWSERRRSLDVEVDFVVRVPAGVDLDAATVSGDVRVEGLRSEVRASTVNGDVFVSTTGIARANTVSGSIEVELGSTGWTDLDFETVSGDITLWLPEGVETDIDFESVSGDIHSDFDVTTRGRRSGRWIGAEMEGYIGEGGQRSLTLNTVSGDVRLRRAR